MNGQQIDCIADTSAIIGLSRRDLKVTEILSGRKFAITFVTLAELSLGILKASKPDAAWSRVQDVIRDRQMFHVSTITPAVYARIYYDLEQRGVMIPINDIWIAALALEARLPIVARDEHFSRVRGLTVISC
jgi:predicted nucleic acid-binding protein